MSYVEWVVAAITLGIFAVAAWTGLLSLLRNPFSPGLRWAQSAALTNVGLLAVMTACMRIFSAKAG